MPETSNAQLAQNIIEAREELNRRLKAMLPDFERMTNDLVEAVRPISEGMNELLEPFDAVASGNENYNSMRAAANQAIETVASAQMLVERFKNRQMADAAMMAPPAPMPPV